MPTDSPVRPPGVTRRDLLRSAFLALGLPRRIAGAVPAGRVGIVGGGMAGVALAWLLDGQRDVVLLEEQESIGGNVRSVPLELDGETFVVDVGAQYFHPGPYPLYTALLGYLGLDDPDHPESSQARPFPASITLFAAGESPPRFLSPLLPERAWPLLAPWNRAGTGAFAVAFREAKRRERRGESWMVTLEDWLPTLGLSREQWEGMILPWAASLFSGSLEEARSMSARAAMVFAAKALPDNPLDPLLYYTLEPGMIEPLRLLIARSPGVQVMTGAAVQQVTRDALGFTIRCVDGRTVVVDDLVLAASRPGTLRLLQDIPEGRARRTLLEQVEFRDTQIAVHTDPLYAPSRAPFRSFLNSRIDGGTCEASMWLADVLAGVSRPTAARIWKSWITNRSEPPADVLHQASFTHMLPTAGTLRAQNLLRLLQGRDRIWLAGGYTLPYDSQESALRSALRVALGLQAATPRGRALLGAADPLED